MRILLPFLLALPFALPFASLPAAAAERSVGIGSFDRLRVDGPFEVRIATGTSPAARISGSRDAIEAVEVRVDGRTLVVRPGASVWGERPGGNSGGGGEPMVVTLGTTSLASITSIAGARITATAAKADRVDLSVSGGGAIAVAGSAADDVVATVIGAGTIAIAGRTTRARLIVSGPGSIDAGALDAGDLVARLDGVGAITARARYTAGGSNSGLGTIAVAGSPKCLFRTPAGSRVTCGGK